MSAQYFLYDDIAMTILVFAAVLGFLVLVWNAVKAIDEWRSRARKPVTDRIDDHEKRIIHLENCCADVTGKLQNDWLFQQDETEMNRLLLKSIMQLLKHSIDGNDTEGLKAMEKEINSYLVNHAQ